LAEADVPAPSHADIMLVENYLKPVACDPQDFATEDEYNQAEFDWQQEISRGYFADLLPRR
jgi:hypothetical protein